MEAGNIRLCGVCPKCGSPMTGETVHEIRCVACGAVQPLHPDDIAFLQEMLEQHERRQKEDGDA